MAEKGGERDEQRVSQDKKRNDSHPHPHIQHHSSQSLIAVIKFPRERSFRPQVRPHLGGRRARSVLSSVLTEGENDGNLSGQMGANGLTFPPLLSLWE